MSEGHCPAPAGPLPKSCRVRRRSEYLRIQGKGVWLQTKNFAFVLSLRNESTDAIQGPRFGLVVSKKVGNAVQRNRTKRLLREAFRCVRLLLDAHLDIVVIPRAFRPELKLDDVVHEWAGAEERIKRVCARLRLAQSR